MPLRTGQSITLAAAAAVALFAAGWLVGHRSRSAAATERESPASRSDVLDPATAPESSAQLPPRLSVSSPAVAAVESTQAPPDDGFPQLEWGFDSKKMPSNRVEMAAKAVDMRFFLIFDKLRKGEDLDLTTGLDERSVNPDGVIPSAADAERLAAMVEGLNQEIREARKSYEAARYAAYRASAQNATVLPEGSPINELAPSDPAERLAALKNAEPNRSIDEAIANAGGKDSFEHILSSDYVDPATLPKTSGELVELRRSGKTKMTTGRLMIGITRAGAPDAFREKDRLEALITRRTQVVRDFYAALPR